MVVTYVSRDDVHNRLRPIWLVDHPVPRKLRYQEASCLLQCESGRASIERQPDPLYEVLFEPESIDQSSRVELRLQRPVSALSWCVCRSNFPEGQAVNTSLRSLSSRNVTLERVPNLLRGRCSDLELRRSSAVVASL